MTVSFLHMELAYFVLVYLTSCKSFEASLSGDVTSFINCSSEHPSTP